MEKFNTPENSPYESVDHSDITDAELNEIFGEDTAKDEVAKAMGEKLANAFFDEIHGAEANGTLDQVSEKNRTPESPSIEETLAELDKKSVDAEVSPITDEDIYNWIDGNEK